jgi:UDP-N-acetylmuramoyl-tripeptide--D-alanyl-D-alanine ligase
VLNGDDPWLRQLVSRSAAKVLWIGRDGDCDLKAVDIRSAEGQLRFRVGAQRYEIPIWGRHHLTAAMAAIAIGLEFGLSSAEIAAALADFQPPAGRCRVTDVAGARLIDDSYNASPTAMRAAFDLLREMDAPGERVVVFGDMKELGTGGIRLHKQLGEEVVTRCGADRLIACGEHADEVVFAARKAGMPAVRTTALRLAAETIPLVKEAIRPGAAVLVKGSRAMAMEQVVAGLRRAA